MPKNSKTTYVYKLFRVKRSNGKVTTVSLNPELYTQAQMQVPGGDRAVGQFIRECAKQFEPGMNKSCSGYCSSKLQAYLTELRNNRAKAAAAATASAGSRVAALA